MADPPPGFCAVPGGDLLLGYHESDAANDWYRNNWIDYLSDQGYPINGEIASEHWPAGKVHVDGFYMQKFEVTNSEYLDFINAAGRKPPRHWKGGRPPKDLYDHPVVNVTYEDALAFCEWKTNLAAQAGRLHIYSLPTHRQWEKAAKAPILGGQDEALTEGAARLYPWGDQWGSGNLHDENSRGQHTVSVRHHQGVTSDFGVCDLAGNVAECVDGGEIKNGQVWKHIRGASFRKLGQIYALNFFYGLELVAMGVFQDDIGFRCAICVRPERPPAQAVIPLGNDGYVNGQGQTQFISRFYMARFAVSNEEFSEFKPSHVFRESEQWRPVTNVSYQEAVDFCKWKSQQEGKTYRLPTRDEWERAYRGTEARLYPWGKEYSRYYCNSLESGWGRPVDVWSHWHGATPEGIYNLCGNTFEWQEGGEAVGGSWCSTCASYGQPPYRPDDTVSDGGAQLDIGFRYVTQ
jgi:formylglycine-generating enzyme required for sulfatase activity